MCPPRAAPARRRTHGGRTASPRGPRRHIQHVRRPLRPAGEGARVASGHDDDVIDRSVVDARRHDAGCSSAWIFGSESHRIHTHVRSMDSTYWVKDGGRVVRAIPIRPRRSISHQQTNQCPSCCCCRWDGFDGPKLLAASTFLPPYVMGLHQALVV